MGRNSEYTSNHAGRIGILPAFLRYVIAVSAEVGQTIVRIIADAGDGAGVDLARTGRDGINNEINLCPQTRTRLPVVQRFRLIRDCNDDRLGIGEILNALSVGCSRTSAPTIGGAANVAAPDFGEQCQVESESLRLDDGDQS